MIRTKATYRTMAVPDVKEYGFRPSLAATAAGMIALMRLGTADTAKCSDGRHSAPSSSNRQETQLGVSSAMRK
jgi:hypothetical protein